MLYSLKRLRRFSLIQTTNVYIVSFLQTVMVVVIIMMKMTMIKL